MKNKQVKQMIELSIMNRLKFYEDYCQQNDLLFVVGNCGRMGFIGHNYSYHTYNKALSRHADKCKISLTANQLKSN